MNQPYHPSHRKKVIARISELILVLIIFFLGFFGTTLSIELYPQIFRSEVSLQNNVDIMPRSSIVLNFSYPMNERSVLENIAIRDSAEVDYQWSNAGKTLTVAPKKTWKIGATYTIALGQSRNVFWVRNDEKLTFRTADYPSVVSFYPAKGEKKVIFDIEDPISVQFDKQISNFKVKFVVKPAADLVYKLGEDGKSVQLIPNGEIKKGQQYDFSILVRHEDEPSENYRTIHATFFETELPPVPQIWEKDFALRIEQAKQYTQPVISEGKYIDVNLKSQILSIFEGGKLLDAFLISSGKRGMDTPLGNFSIHNKFPRAWSKKYQLFMPFWMAIVPSGQFGIHELPEWPGGYKEGANHLGTPVSHGCVRLGIGSAERVYNWAEIGTPVVVHL